MNDAVPSPRTCNASTRNIRRPQVNRGFLRLVFVYWGYSRSIVKKLTGFAPADLSLSSLPKSLQSQRFGKIHAAKLWSWFFLGLCRGLGCHGGHRVFAESAIPCSQVGLPPVCNHRCRARQPYSQFAMFPIAYRGMFRIQPWSRNPDMLNLRGLMPS